MTTITTRSGKGSPLTNDEVDANFTGLNSDKVETSGDSMTGNLSFGDSDKAVFGAGSDLEIYHTATGDHSIIEETGGGNLVVRTNGPHIEFDKGSTEYMARMLVDGAVELYYDSALKLATSSTGIDVTGVITTDGMTTSADINFGDSDKAIFGAGSDLQIYHDPSVGSIIQEAGAGSLFVRASTNIQLEGVNGENMAIFNENGSVQLYHNNAEKLATSSSGIDVTGTVTADSATIDGALYVNGSGINLDDAYGLSWGDGSAQVRGSGSSEAVELLTSSVVRLNADADGDISFYNSAGNSKNFFWDASTSRLGLGTTDPNANGLHIFPTGDSTNPALQIGGQNTYRLGMYVSGETGHIENRNGDDGIAFSVKTAGEAMRIDGITGNVGIGNASPIAALDVTGTDSTGSLTSLGDTVTRAAAVIRGSTHANGYGLYMGYGNSTTDAQYIQATRASGSTAFPLLINPYGGNVGIGTTSASNKLTVNGDQVLLANGELKFADATNNHVATIKNSGGTGVSQLEFLTGATPTTRMLIDSSGNVAVKGASHTNFEVKSNSESTKAFIQTVQDSDVRIGSSTNHPVSLYQNGTQRMAITSTGASVAGNLIVDAGVNGTIDFGNVTSAYGRLYADSTGTYVGSYTNNPLVLRTNNAERMRVDSSGVDITNGHIKLSAGYSLQWDDSHERIEQSNGNLEFFTNNSQQMTIKGSAVGIGTTSPSYVLHASTADNTIAQFQSTDNRGAILVSDDDTNSYFGSEGGSTYISNSGGALSSGQLVINSSGNVGIGNDSFTNKLNVTGAMGSAGTPLVQLSENSGNARDGLYLDYTGTTNSAVYSLKIADASKTHLAVRGDGNVGIGEADPDAKLDIRDIGGRTIQLGKNPTTNYFGSSLYMSVDVGSTEKAFNIGTRYSSTGGNLIFEHSTNDMGRSGDASALTYTERMRLDGSGNLLVGTTDTTLFNNTSGGGFSVSSSGLTQIAKQGGDSADPVLLLNQTGLDGEILRFYKDGSTVGTIGSFNSGAEFFIASGDTGIKAIPGIDAVTPSGTSGANRDAIVSLGWSTNRFKDLYLSGGVSNITASGTATSTIISAISGVTNGFQVSANTSNQITYHFNTGAGLKMQLTNAGNLLVGTTSPISGAKVGVANVNGGQAGIGIGNTTGSSLTTAISFRNSNGEVGTIQTSGSATSYNVSSDQRLKDNIVDAPSASDDIDAIQVRSFDWKADGSHQKYGMVAQELNTVAPDAVSAPEDPEDMMGVDYSKLVPMLVKEIQSLRARVAQLEND